MEVPSSNRVSGYPTKILHAFFFYHMEKNSIYILKIHVNSALILLILKIYFFEILCFTPNTDFKVVKHLYVILYFSIL
jgi:hypothetical protein